MTDTCWKRTVTADTASSSLLFDSYYVIVVVVTFNSCVDADSFDSFISIYSFMTTFISDGNWFGFISLPYSSMKLSYFATAKEFYSNV